jgi:hypothetical protein
MKVATITAIQASSQGVQMLFADVILGEFIDDGQRVFPVR